MEDGDVRCNLNQSDLDRLLRRLRTSCNASLLAASLPLPSVARAKWFDSNVDTCLARPECSNSSSSVPTSNTNDTERVGHLGQCGIWELIG